MALSRMCSERTRTCTVQTLTYFIGVFSSSSGHRVSVAYGDFLGAMEVVRSNRGTRFTTPFLVRLSPVLHGQSSRVGLISLFPSIHLTYQRTCYSFPYFHPALSSSYLPYTRQR